MKDCKSTGDRFPDTTHPDSWFLKMDSAQRGVHKTQSNKRREGTMEEREQKSFTTRCVFSFMAEEDSESGWCLRRLLTDLILQRLNEKTPLSIGEKWAVRNDKLSHTSVILTGLRGGRRKEGERDSESMFETFFLRFQKISYCWDNVRWMS